MKFVLALWALILLGFLTKTVWLVAGGLIIWIILLITPFFRGGGGGGRNNSNYDDGSPGTQG